MAEEKIYTIPLRKAFSRAPRNMRSKRAVREVRDYIARHTHTADVKIGPALNRLVWKQGIEKPPASVRVKVRKEKDSVYVEMVGAEFSAEEKQAAKKGAEEAKKEISAKAAPEAAAQQQ